MSLLAAAGCDDEESVITADAAPLDGGGDTAVSDGGQPGDARDAKAADATSDSGADGTLDTAGPPDAADASLVLDAGLLADAADAGETDLAPDAPSDLADAGPEAPDLAHDGDSVTDATWDEMVTADADDSGAPEVSVSPEAGADVPCVPALVIEPSRFAFMPTVVGELSVVQPFTITNKGCATAGADAHFGVSVGLHFQIKGSDCGSTLEPDTSCTVDVAFGPTSVGEKTGRLIVLGEPKNALTVELSGVGKTRATVADADVPGAKDASADPDGAEPDVAVVVPDAAVVVFQDADGVDAQDGAPDAGDGSADAAPDATGLDAEPDTADPDAAEPDAAEPDAASPLLATDIPGLAFWFDAARLLELDDDGRVGRWRDLSGNGHIAHNSTLSARPGLDATGANGRPLVVYDETKMTKLYVGQSPSLDWGTGAFTVMAVGKTTQTGARSGLLIQKVAVNGWALVVNRDTFGHASFWLSTSTKVLSPTPGYNSGALMLMVGRRVDPTTIELRVNGVLLGKKTVSEVDVTNIAVMEVGHANFRGGLAEVVGVKGAVSDEHLAAMERSLMQKYGIAAP